jgi:hypothetical protein
MAANLWLGLYCSSAEWPWTYFFLLVIQIMLLVQRPGRSLGLDAILLRRQQKLVSRQRFMGSSGSSPVVIHSWVDAMTGRSRTVPPRLNFDGGALDSGLKARTKGRRASLVDCEILAHAERSECRARCRP